MKPLYPHHLFGTLSGMLLIALFMVEYPAPSSSASRPLDGRGTLERSERIAATTGIAVERSDTLGAYLTDRGGRALYLFKADSTRKRTRYDACPGAWPPLRTHGTLDSENPRVQDTVLGTIRREGGQSQVTYNGWPLHYVANDAGAGPIRGQVVKGFGVEWYLISPSGHEVHAASAQYVECAVAGGTQRN